MNRRRSYAMIAESEEAFLSTLPEEEATESGDELEIFYSERRGSIELFEFTMSCCGLNELQIDEEVKIVILGAPSVGKTSLV